MRRILYISIIALFAGLGFSCSRERLIPLAGNHEGEPATIMLSASGGVRGLLNGSEGDPDYVITSLRIMLFNTTGTNTLAYNFKIANLNATPYMLNITTGTYHFVFIANEDSDEVLRSGSTLTQILDAYTNTNTLTDIKKEYFSSSAFRNDYSIPMTTIHENVKVNVTNTVTLSGQLVPVIPPWVVEVEHAGIRIDLTLRTDKVITKDYFDKLQIVNVPNKVYLFDTQADGATQNYNNGAYESDSPIPDWRSFAKNKGDELSSTLDPADGNVIILNPGTKSFEADLSNAGWWVWHKRIILPSSYFSDKTDKDKAILFQAIVNGRSVEGTLGSDITGTNPYGYVAPRNQRYRLIATLNADQPIEFTILHVKDWGATPPIPVPAFFDVSPTDLTFAYNASGSGAGKPVFIETNMPGGWTYTVSNTADFTVDELRPTPGTGRLTVYPKVKNTGNTPLECIITIISPPMNPKTVTVTQAGN